VQVLCQIKVPGQIKHRGFYISCCICLIYKCLVKIIVLLKALPVPICPYCQETDRYSLQKNEYTFSHQGYLITLLCNIGSPLISDSLIRYMPAGNSAIEILSVLFASFITPPNALYIFMFVVLTPRI
jgi:hypothetical protein